MTVLPMTLPNYMQKYVHFMTADNIIQDYTTKILSIAMGEKLQFN